MSKFSVVMLVSRYDKKFRQAVESVISYEPDGFRAYIDTVALDQFTEPVVVRALKNANATICRQRPFFPYSDRHVNIVVNYHRAMLEAAHEWVIKFDDDDLLLGPDRHRLIAQYDSDRVGIIHGDKIVKYPYWEYVKSLQLLQFGKALVKPKRYFGSKPKTPADVRLKIFGGTAMIRKEAFEQIHSLLSYSGDASYFYDFETFYHILRAGWKSAYVPEVLFQQNMNPHPDPERKRRWGTWGAIADKLDKDTYL